MLSDVVRLLMLCPPPLVAGGMWSVHQVWRCEHCTTGPLAKDANEGTAVHCMHLVPVITVPLCLVPVDALSGRKCHAWPGAPMHVPSWWECQIRTPGTFVRCTNKQAATERWDPCGSCEPHMFTSPPQRQGFTLVGRGTAVRTGGSRVGRWLWGGVVRLQQRCTAVVHRILIHGVRLNSSGNLCSEGCRRMAARRWSLEQAQHCVDVHAGVGSAAGT